MTWNMKWFPSGRVDLRSSAAAEAAALANAARIVSGAVADQNSRSSADIVMFAQEMRDAACCTNLAAAVGIPGLKVAAVSCFTDNSGVPLWQQEAILTTLPVLRSGYAVWSNAEVSIPRGFAYALLDAGANTRIACFSIHLKSNFTRADSEFENQKNIFKREAAAAQILAVVKRLGTTYADKKLQVLVGGDFNTSEDDLAYVSEATLRSFYGAHFRSCFRDLKPHQRITHPAANGYGDATLDYILYRGFERIVSRKIYPGAPLSDHNLVALRLR
ncbi:MAG: endonuclease/exonuclease/phosphatase family protein [Kiritimatiellae bacterium]|nr:endonuclease/exonuclease/phosphatase family protein [Kiritimatiellia bacterium]